MAIRIPTAKELRSIKHYYGFKYLLNSQTHESIFQKLQIEAKYKDLSKLKVLDLYPGPSNHSALFVNLFKPAQYMLMDSRPDFLRHIESFTKGTSLQFYKHDPYEWKSYIDLIEKDKLFIPSIKPRDLVHDECLVIANLTGMIGEGLFMQWLACIGNKNWLQKYGRIRMLVWVPESTAIKVLAKPGEQIRSKCSVVADTFTDTRLIATTNSTSLRKFNSKILEKHEPILFPTEDIWLTGGKPISLLEVTPKEHNVDLDNWDYVTKHLLILKSTPLLEALDSLGHGAKDYFTGKLDREFLKKTAKDLDTEEFLYLTNLFDKWPFKPDIYMDFIDVFQDND
ncbi:LAFE_0E06634g1_1 [Lachancea fermentati]|uniref:Mitochondrial transcription factor 1 n=1 Tax=Lachancea fermentati TaxID=4955 RepID=A0A1G4MD24_LACFM|nr:LAFE_0E06634g1_1 [Lachancea fermentati]